MMYAIEMSDGSVEIMQTVPQLVGLDEDKRPVWRDPTPEECIGKWAAEHRARVVSHKLIERSAVPTDRTFRNAWKLNGRVVDHDMPKARAIHLARIRAARAALFIDLDADWMRATGQKDILAADAVEAERQKLRDLPQTIAADIERAATADELKTVWPAVLGERPAPTSQARTGRN